MTFGSFAIQSLVRTEGRTLVAGNQFPSQKSNLSTLKHSEKTSCNGFRAKIKKLAKFSVKSADFFFPTKDLHTEFARSVPNHSILVPGNYSVNYRVRGSSARKDSTNSFLRNCSGERFRGWSSNSLHVSPSFFFVRPAF